MQEDVFEYEWTFRAPDLLKKVHSFTDIGQKSCCQQISSMLSKRKFCKLHKWTVRKQNLLHFGQDLGFNFSNSEHLHSRKYNV